MYNDISMVTIVFSEDVIYIHAVLLILLIVIY